MDKFVKFLNSGIGLVLVGALVGAIGLFTWQRMDWLSKQEYLRAQVMLDRKIDLIEKINADVGSLVAAADSVIAVIAKQASGKQRNQVIEIYNDEQARWFGLSASHQALLGFYFPQSISDEFAKGIVNATKNLDVKVYKYAKESTKEQRMGSYEASRQVRRQLQAWNKLAMKNLQSHECRSSSPETPI